MDYYLLDNQNFPSPVSIWINLESIVLNKIKQALKDKYYTFLLISAISKTCNYRSRNLQNDCEVFRGKEGITKYK